MEHYYLLLQSIGSVKQLSLIFLGKIGFIAFNGNELFTTQIIIVVYNPSVVL